MRQVEPPVVVCEAVLTETACFLGEDGHEVDPLFAMVERGRCGWDSNSSSTGQGCGR